MAILATTDAAGFTLLLIATGNRPGTLTSPALPFPPMVTVICRVEFAPLTDGNLVSLPPNSAVTVGFSVVPKKPPFTLKATGEPVPCGMLSGDVPTTAGRTGERFNWQGVRVGAVAHATGELPCCATEKVKDATVAGCTGAVV